MRSEEGTLITLAGQVVECDYAGPEGEEGFYSLMLLVDGDEEFIIEPGQEGGRLEEYLERWVEVKAEMYEEEDATFIVVHEFDAEDSNISYDSDW